MARVSKLLSWFCFSLAGVLVTVAMLAVPENAFADAGTDWCNNYCLGVCGSDPMCYSSCFTPCEDGWQSCDLCGNYSGAQYTYCSAGCNAQPVWCHPGDDDCKKY